MSQALICCASCWTSWANGRRSTRPRSSSAGVAEREQVLADQLIAERELHGALHKLAALVTVRRLEALEAKDIAVGLNAAEKQEYLTLMSNNATRDARGG